MEGILQQLSLRGGSGSWAEHLMRRTDNRRWPTTGVMRRLYRDTGLHAGRATRARQRNLAVYSGFGWRRIYFIGAAYFYFVICRSSWGCILLNGCSNVLSLRCLMRRKLIGHINSRFSFHVMMFAGLANLYSSNVLIQHCARYAPFFF